MPIEMIEEFDQGTQIKVIGVGGGGGNAEHRANGVEVRTGAGLVDVEAGEASAITQHDLEGHRVDSPR